MKKLAFCFLVVCFNLLTAQKEAAIWYFGRNAGLDFNSGAPVLLTDGALDTREGCASISDPNGNLLFYTDGLTVWNRNHQPMPNGTGLNGDPSSTQAAIIIPKSDEPNIFYIFTVDDYGGPNGLQYSILDLNLDSGLGGITTQKNILLQAQVSEKITAIQHADRESVWVVTKGWENNNFYSYQIDENGVNPTPVTTPIGFTPQLNNRLTVGYLKASPDGRFLGSASEALGVMEIFRFNANTGVVSDLISLQDYFDNTWYDMEPYGVEFSPNGKVLYVSTRGGILQFDISNYEHDAIVNSAVRLGGVNTSTPFFGAIQLAIDGKIYCARYGGQFLDVIHEPNILGLAANYEEQGISLGSRRSLLGLPPFLTSYFYVGIKAENLCFGDLTEFSLDVSNPVTSILWDFGDGINATTEVPTHVYANPGDYTVTVEVTTATGITSEIKDITIFETPIANTPGDLVGCTSYGSYNIDLPSFNPTVLATQDTTIFTVDYFLSQADSDNNTNPLEPIHQFDYGTTPVFVRVSNANNEQCYDTTQFNIIAREAPIVEIITDWTVCDDDTDGLYIFDLSLKNIEIFNGQDETTFEILYFASQTDADTGTNVLPVSYTNTLPTEEIFVRIQNSTYPTCFRTGSFMIAVTPGVTANIPSNLEICDDNNDGYSTFNLADTEPEIIGTQSASSLSISYYATMTDAESNLNSLPISYTNSVANKQTIYVRVANATDVNCYATTSFEVNVFDTPQLQTVTDWLVCDNDNDGVFDFNLTEKNNEILGNQNPTDVSIRYYESLSDAILAQNEITGTYQNTANPQTLFYRLDNSMNTTCFVTSSFDLEVFETPFALASTPIIGCDINETGSQTIDLTQKNSEILGNQDPSQFTVAFYASPSDAENSINELSANSYINTQSQETLYARVERIGLESCYALTSLEISINPLPQTVLEERYVICPDSPALVIDGGDFESWFWQNANGTEISTTRFFDVTDLGEYQLTVSQTNNGITCENSETFEVVSSGAPESIVVDTKGFSDQIDVTVTATGTGPFEYSVDGENYQASNAFTVFPGKYTVYVRDLEECRILSEEIIAIGYQRFFTPNGDGNNEYWNIIGSELYPGSQLYIYDRYGKFLKQLSADSKGWDGKSNAISLPESDYWFKYNYANNQVMTGHFTLKR
ncbi:gliding motility-associated C-terminal domain-containing protein [Maribacter orientalis]|uniref:Gliding motility-associated C-terminal domain-containing protein n=1 Tax=Maribacter orientalis TaxID=228957 RepID=A0A1H7TKD5_9FLAO|nr:T9SS type B sorting domain-containing protein [Maribacter orientalis]SEL84796.1 gliding motility-associated C-terminal domain-containing protein [Maribacter orientalis]